mmetsp:Transcript_60025/g.186203  ORF Transcript_60025/g.186203 Transcript_60025/m.186203 type:complete len:243 (-) Transcript_60025:293-1021(-)
MKLAWHAKARPRNDTVLDARHRQKPLHEGQHLLRLVLAQPPLRPDQVRESPKPLRVDVSRKGMKVADLEACCFLCGDVPVGAAARGVVAVDQVQTDALWIAHKAHLLISKCSPEPAHELIVLAETDMRERVLQGDLSVVCVGEAKAVDDSFVAPGSIHGVRVSDLVGVGIAVVPGTEGQRFQVALLQAVDHGGDIAGSIQVVIVKVNDVLARCQMSAQVPLEADGQRRLKFDVDDALAQAPG